MIKKSGQYGVPVITIDGEIVVGFDRGRLEALIAQQKVTAHPSLGISVADAAGVASKQGLLPVFGAYVGGVKPGSVGERAGLQQGDIITELNLRPINNASDLEKAMENISPNARITIVFLRGQQTLRTEVTV